MNSDTLRELRIMRSAQNIHRINGSKELWYMDLSKARSLYDNPDIPIKVGKTKRA